MEPELARSLLVNYETALDIARVTGPDANGCKTCVACGETWGPVRRDAAFCSEACKKHHARVRRRLASGRMLTPTLEKRANLGANLRLQPSGQPWNGEEQ